ncbi:hypothetical protein IW262DRAFT_1227980, partial [Armillaria fumosa]
MMVNPGMFQGVRKEFLLGEVDGYAQAIVEDRAAEQVMDVTRRYLKRFPMSLPQNINPSPEELAKVDDNMPDLE